MNVGSPSQIPPDSLTPKLADKALSENALRGRARTVPTRAELWLHRIRVLVLVFVCATVGVLLVILPWRPEWTDNDLLLGWPGLRTFMSQRFCPRPVQRSGTAGYLDRILGSRALPRRSAALNRLQPFRSSRTPFCRRFSEKKASS